MNVSGEEFAMLDEVVSSIYNRGIKDGMEVSENMYQQGLNDAWECARKILNMPQDVYYKLFNSERPFYAITLHSAVECIQKIKEYEEQQKDDEKSCGTCKHVMRIDCGAYPCNECPRDTLPKWEPKQTDATDINDGSIKVGDEVRIKGSDPVKDDCDYGVCTRSLPNVNTMYVMRRDGSSGEENKDEWYRTGRFFPQIAVALKLLRGEA